MCSGNDNSSNYRPTYPPQLVNGRAISFPPNTGFTKVPTVMVALDYVDFGPNSSQGSRIQSNSGTITTTGFTWSADSWANTTVNAVGISYIAFGDV